jgi:hypothetical protein
MSMSRPGAFGDMRMTAAVLTRRAEGRPSAHRRGDATKSTERQAPSRDRIRAAAAPQEMVRGVVSVGTLAGAQPGVARDGRCGDEG